MSRKEEYEQKTEELLTPVVSGFGFELVDVEYVKEGGTWYLRAYIDKPGGITVDDCEAVSRAFSDILDEKDILPTRMYLRSAPRDWEDRLKKKRIMRAVWARKWRFGLTVPLTGRKNLKEF